MSDMEKEAQYLSSLFTKYNTLSGDEKAMVDYLTQTGIIPPRPGQNFSPEQIKIMSKAIADRVHGNELSTNDTTTIKEGFFGLGRHRTHFNIQNHERDVAKPTDNPIKTEKRSFVKRLFKKNNSQLFTFFLVFLSLKATIHF